MAQDFWEAIKQRRSYYNLGDTPGISDEKIKGIVEDAIKYVPSAFNSQSARALVLLGAAHKQLWDIVAKVMQGVVPPEQFPATQNKLNSFKAGYGTVLFFEDMAVVEGLQAQYPLYQDNFPLWSLQSSGMLQFTVWTALEAEGLGVSLQHYNPLIDDEVKRTWNIPEKWKLWSQMVLGSINGVPDEKIFNYKNGDMLCIK